MTDPLPPELKDLVAAERAAPAPDAAARAAARARLAAAVGHAPPGAAGAFGAGKVLAILAVVVAAGTFTVLHARGESHGRAVAPAVATAPAAPPAVATPATEAIVGPRPTEQLAAPMPAPARAEERSAATTSKQKSALSDRGGQSLRSSTAAIESTPEPSHAPASTPPTPQTSTPSVAAVETTSQAELIRRAWSALAVGEPERALAIVREDDQLHRDGALDEERDAVRIVALARLGHLDEARLAATQFEHDYPTSLHHDLVTRALAGGPDQDR